MKKLITILAISIATITANAQITLENTYSASSSVNLINLSVSGYKYATVNSLTHQVKFYNMNHSLWKTINLIAGPNKSFEVIKFTEQLFNTDNLMEISYSQYGGTHPDSMLVMNENGNILFTSFGYYSIVNDGSNFKMIIRDTLGTSSSVYSLPGTLPCDACGGFSGISEPSSNDGKQMISNPYPNPTNDKTTINYELPEGINQGKIAFYDIMGNYVKGFMVDRTFKDLQISNADLAAGTYYYQLQTSKGMSGGKKLMVIK